MNTECMWVVWWVVWCMSVTECMSDAGAHVWGWCVARQRCKR